MPSLYKRPNGKWYVAWWTEGIQHRKSLRTSDEKVAREAFGDFDYNYRHGLLGLPGRKSRIPLLGELFDEYLAFMKDHREPRTYKHAELYVRLFLRPAFGKIKAHQLTNKHVEDFVGRLKNWKDADGKLAPYHPETINKRLKCLGTVLKRAARPGGVLDRVPVLISEHLLSSPRPLPKYITPDQFSLWAPHITRPLNRCRAVIELCTGIPDSELARLSWNENYSKEMGVLKYLRAKTTVEIVVNLNLWALEAIADLEAMKNGPLIFHGIKSAKSAYKVASAKSGINVTPHMLRHSFATWALSEGESIEKISATLGHASISTTQIYARVMPTWRIQTTNTIDRLRPPSTLRPVPHKGRGKTMHNSKTTKSRSKR